MYVIVRPMSGSGLTDYDEFFAETRPNLVGLGLALTGDLQIAQELAQEALTRAWVHWRRIRSYDQPAAWARRVVRNLAADRASACGAPRRPCRSSTCLHQRRTAWR